MKPRERGLYMVFAPDGRSSGFIRNKAKAIRLCKAYPGSQVRGLSLNSLRGCGYQPWGWDTTTFRVTSGLVYQSPPRKD